MRHPKHIVPKDKGDESVFGVPSIVLLKPEHWSYIRRRYHMSWREIQVAELVCKGYSNGEIARELKIKPGTVKTHLRNVYRRIRVRNKITMLLKVLDQATKFSARSEVSPPIPVVGIRKSVTKPVPLTKIHKKGEQTF